MVGQVAVVLLIGGAMYFEGLNLYKKKYYYDMFIAGLFYVISFYYGLAYASGWDVYNPLDALMWLFEPLGVKLFIDILGI